MSQIEDQDSSLAKMKKANAELEQQNIECRRNLELVIDNMDLQKAKVVTEILSWMDKSPSLDIIRSSCRCTIEESESGEHQPSNECNNATMNQANLSPSQIRTPLITYKPMISKSQVEPTIDMTDIAQSHSVIEQPSTSYENLTSSSRRQWKSPRQNRNKSPPRRLLPYQGLTDSPICTPSCNIPARQVASATVTTPELHRPSCTESGQDCPGQSPCEREQNVLDTDSGLTLKERRIIDRPIDSILGRPSMSLYQTYIYANTLKPKHRLIGEISFQLERRILDYVFGKKQGLGRTGDTSRRRFYGYTLRNIVAKIEEEVRSESEGIDSIAEASMKHSLRYIKRILCPLDYDIDFHGDFAEKMVNHYGLLNTSPEKSTIENFGLEDPRVLRVLLAKLIADETVLKHMLILLDSLCLLAHHDKRPLFLW